MGGLVDFVEDVVGGAADLVGDAVSAIGGAIVDVVDFVVDDIISPVVDTVGNVIQAALDDPIKTIAQVAAVATGNAWALPLIEGADVAIAGGDLGDILEATAKAYVAQEVGSYVGKTVSGAVSNAATAAEYGVSAGSQQAAMLAAQEAGMATSSQIAGQIIGSASAASAVAVVTGRDPVKAFLTGGVSAAVPAVLGQVSGFTKLPPSAQQVISQAVTTQLAGGNVTTAIIGSAIQASGIVTDILKSFDPDGTKLTNAQRAIATDVLMGSATAALSGGNVSAAIQSALIKNGSKALGDMLTTGFKNAVKGVETKYSAAQKAADAVDANIAQQEEVARKYNTVVNNLNARVAEQDRLKSVYDKAVEAQKANPTQATTDAANNAAKAYNDYVAVLNKDYNDTIKPQIDQYAKQLADIQTTYGNLEKVYQNAIKDVGTSTDGIKTQLGTVIDTSNKEFVTALDPAFNAEEYRKLNGLGADVDVYDHWLSTGQFEGLKTNNAAAQGDIVAEKVRLIQELADKKGVSLAQISDTDAKNFFAKVDSTYGGNLSTLKNASIQDFLTGNTKTYDDLLKDSASDGFKIEVSGQAYGDWNKSQLSGYTPPSGTRLATQEEFENNTASLSYTDDGKPVWLAADQGVKVWDSKLGDYVYQMPEVVVTAPKLEDLQADDPEAWLVMAGSIPGDGKGGIDDFLYNFAQATMNLAKASGNSTLINSAGNALKAGGGILQSFNGLVTLAGLNPNTTSVGKFADKLVKLGQATTTDEYRAAVADINKTIGDAKGVYGTAKAIWGAFENHPIEFLAEIVGVEGMQEVVPLLIGGGATTAARGLALAKGMGKIAAERFAAKAGISAAMASDIAESVGGTAQNTFNTAYQLAINKGMTEAQATQTALDMAAKSGLVSGVVTAASMGVGGAALEKAILGKVTTGELGTVIDQIAKRVAQGGTITIKEGVSEGIEEGLTTAYTEGLLYQLDPTRDIAANITSSAILGALAGGPIAGGSYAGAVTGDIVSNLLVTSNPQVAEIVSGAAKTSAGATAAVDALKKLGIEDQAILTNLANNIYDAGYTSRDEALDAFNARSDYKFTDAEINSFVGNTSDTKLAAAVESYVDPRYVDVEEVKAAAKAEGYTITNEQALALVGQKDEATAIADARAQFDPLATTYEEAKALFKDTYGYTPTYAEVQSFVKSVAEEQSKADIGAYVDPRQVTFDEAKQYLTDLGYKPTDAEVQKFVAQVSETTQQKAVADYVDPRMVDEQEVRDAYAALGLAKPTQADVAKLIGQYAESDLAGKAEANLDPARYNSIMEQLDGLTAGASQEVLDAVALVKKDLNSQITALGGDIATLSGDVATAKSDLLGAIKDAQTGNTERFGDIDKAIQDLKDAGLSEQQVQDIVDKSTTGLSKDFKDALAEAVKGNTDALSTVKTDLETKIGDVQTALETALSGQTDTFNAAVKDLMDQGKTYQEATEKALADMGVQITDLGTDFATKLGDVQTALGTQITDLSTQLADVETNIYSKMAEYEKAGIERDEALSKAIADVATDLGTTKEDLLTQIGTTEQNLQDQVNTVETNLGTKITESQDAILKELGLVQTGLSEEIAGVKTDLQTQIDTVQTSILDRVAEYEAAGITRDEALGLAIADVAGQLGTTEENLLSAIGTTEQNLALQITGVEENLTRDIQTKYDALTDNQKALADQLTQQGVDLNTAIETAKGQLQTQIGDLQTTIGTDTQQASQADLDAVINLLEQQGAYDPNYDYNGDQVIDQNDKTAIEQYLSGATDMPWAPAAGSKWAPTGMFGTMAANQAATQKAIADEAERTRQANAAAALQTQRFGNLNTMMGMLTQAPDLGGQQVTVKAADPAKIGYIYDWNSIFANPSQEKMFASPYGTFAQGGMVRDDSDDVNDELLKILRG